MTHHALSADKELSALAARSNVALERVVTRLLRAKLEHEDESEHLAELRRMLAQTLALASLLGSRRTLLQARARARGLPTKMALERSPAEGIVFAGDIVSPLVSAVSFDQAIKDMLTRHPTLAKGYKRVQEVYSKGHAFALAKSTSLVLTRKIRDVLGAAIKQGSGQFKTTQVIKSLSGWSTAYADVIFSTNACTAYTAGVVQQSYDPEVMEICPAMEFIGRKVDPSRPNHIAAVGLIAGTKESIWNDFTPPLGYRCTHSLNQCDRWDLEKKGLLIKVKGSKDFLRNADGSLAVRTFKPAGFAAAGADPGFRVEGGAGLSTRLGLASERMMTFSRCSRDVSGVR